MYVRIYLNYKQILSICNGIYMNIDNPIYIDIHRYIDTYTSSCRKHIPIHIHIYICTLQHEREREINTDDLLTNATMTTNINTRINNHNHQETRNTIRLH